MRGQYLWLVGGVAVGLGVLYVLSQPSPPPAIAGGSQPSAPPAGGSAAPTSGSESLPAGKTGGVLNPAPEVAPPRISIATTPAMMGKWVQQRLGAMGFYSGPVDGAMSAEFADAIRRFQASKGLTVNGQLDDALIRELG